MTFEDKVKEFVKTIPNKLEHIDSEETTKIALITPFLRILGYDTTDPSVVRAEYTADVGTKQGEKVDFAILEDGEPVIFIECKPVMNELSTDNVNQLFRYISVTDVQIGILTNGVDYKFYTTDKDNRMDDKPFFVHVRYAYGAARTRCKLYHTSCFIFFSRRLSSHILFAELIFLLILSLTHAFV